MHEKISESLAGRAYFYTLLPLSIKELKTADLLLATPEDQLVKGFYPKVYAPNIEHKDYYDNYISTYVERDIRTIKNIDNILTFKKFMLLCALRVGTTINFTDLATNCGISMSTAKSWLSLLQTSFVVFELSSYPKNLGKRITKSPKLYFYDVGLALALMGIDKETVIAKRDLYGALFENMIIVDVIKNCFANNIRSNLTFFRDTNQNEIDLIMEVNGRTIPVEVKATQTIQSSFFKTIEWFNTETKNEEPGIVVFGGDANQTRTKAQIVSWKNIEQIIGL